MADGYRNSGSHNSGSYNSGHYNTGSHNTGSCNSGSRNSGSYNTGSFNSGSHNVGIFMTTTPEEVPAFNGPPVNRDELFDSIPGWLWSVDPARHNGDMRAAYAAAWADSDQDVAAVEGILGFNRNVWIKITGLDLWADDETEPLETITVNGVTYVRAQD